jgi:hypothetical protein
MYITLSSICRLTLAIVADGRFAVINLTRSHKWAHDRLTARSPTYPVDLGRRISWPLSVPKSAGL